MTLASALLLSLPTVGSLAAQVHTHDHASPYADYMGREIKALSSEELVGLLGGKGLGMALPAELNGFPGPRHVLELGEMLELSGEQRAEVQAVFESMQAQARALGSEIVELERDLDHAFASRTITEERLMELLDGIASRRARLRGVHLRAHLRVLPILTEPQRAHYMEARGYGG